ncbi:hypothetical protein CBP23_04155 [Fischerella thermalis WC344]|jgi:hypothetical protein|nr:hypothetical protein CBP26_22005 [Fischerella thermalis WC538]PLZ66421.1 hypothetical protein CBP23_04155 [Fischerella thermalis WC344]
MVVRNAPNGCSKCRHVNVKPSWFAVNAMRKSNTDATMVKLSNVKITGKLRDTETVMRSLEGGGWKSANNGNSLATHPTSTTVLKPSMRGDSHA